MTTLYTDRWIIFVEIDRTATANNLAAVWDPDTGGHKTFGNVRLSASGEEPATHTGCNTAATGPMTQGIETALGAVPWASLYDVGEGWTWKTALSDAGLQRIEPSFG